MPFPASYVVGVDAQRLDFEKTWENYLGGVVREDGWWYYYLYGLMVKCPHGLQIILATSAVLLVANKSRLSMREIVFYAPPIALFALVSSQTGMNQHFRYCLPILPCLFVFTTRFLEKLDGRMMIRTRCGRWAVCCVLFSLGSVGRAFPDYVAYFNEIGGGARNSGQQMLHSSMDWGQDLDYAQAWAVDHSDLLDEGVAPIKSLYVPYDCALLCPNLRNARHDNFAEIIIYSITDLELAYAHMGRAKTAIGEEIDFIGRSMVVVRHRAR